MNLSPSAQATLLMTSYFSKVVNDGPRPLSIVEWGRFAQWLKEQKRTPGELLTPAANDLLDGWRDKKVDAVRLTQLLSRGHALALAVEKWQRAGLWIMTRADPDYPVQLKARLKTLSPPVLFGCGERRLLNGGGLAVIGSRNANDEDLAFTQRVGFKAASKGITIVSGGARGVDEAAMLGAVDAGGKAIGIVADSLLRSATSKKWRKAVMDGHLALVSPFYPEAGFSVGNAMARNKYIYCLAESSLVIHSGTRGGTLSGAEENLKRNWVPLWVKPTQDSDAANSSLVAKGGRWCEGDIQALDVNSLFVPNTSPAVLENDVQTDMFALDDNVNQMLHDNPLDEGSRASDPIGSDAQDATEQARPLTSESANLSEYPVDFYQVFIGEIVRRSPDTLTTDELVADLSLQKTQVNAWLKQACEDGVVKKLRNPVRYQFCGED